MNVQRGDVVLVDYPYASGTGAKVRPVVVIQNDHDNQRLLQAWKANVSWVNLVGYEICETALRGCDL